MGKEYSTINDLFFSPHKLIVYGDLHFSMRIESINHFEKSSLCMIGDYERMWARERWKTICKSHNVSHFTNQFNVFQSRICFALRFTFYSLLRCCLFFSIFFIHLFVRYEDIQIARMVTDRETTIDSCGSSGSDSIAIRARNYSFCKITSLFRFVCAFFFVLIVWPQSVFAFVHFFHSVCAFYWQ